jgi:D-galactonate transporter
LNTKLIDRPVLALRTDVDATYAKVTWRLIPLLFVCYVMNQMDRFNVGYAHLQMSPELGFSDAVYGLGASMFYIGYVVFEVPSNLLLQRIGARKTILRIMFLWGLATAGTAFVRTPTEFYIARFFLGVFEAGFLPGIVLYLTYWYPSHRRARIVAMFMTAIVVSGIVNGPVSGWILQNMNGVQGMRGWQWMFILEGLPASVIGVMVFFWLADKPRDASWLTDSEREIIHSALHEDTVAESLAKRAATPALRNPHVYILAFVSFAMGCGAYTLAFWTPTMIKGLGIVGAQRIGLYAMLPFLTAAIVMIFLGRSSDKFNERRLHFALPICIGAFALTLTTMTSGNLWLSIALISTAAAGIISSFPIFWAWATSYLTKSTSAAGIGVISSLGALSGVVAPYALGLIRMRTGNLSYGLYFVALVLVMGALIMLLMRSSPNAEA